MKEDKEKIMKEDYKYKLIEDYRDKNKEYEGLYTELWNVIDNLLHYGANGDDILEWSRDVIYEHGEWAKDMFDDKVAYAVEEYIDSMYPSVKELYPKTQIMRYVKGTVRRIIDEQVGGAALIREKGESEYRALKEKMKEVEEEKKKLKEDYEKGVL